MSNSYFSNLMYDIETMFLEGKSALEMADELDLPVEQIIAILEDFGVEA
jgi:hypothetical protein